MSNKSDKTTFWKFLKDNKIEIPIIQRDYAQGRPDKVYLRRNFLKDLKIALNEKSEMHLDFVYGSTNSENGNKMNPLDGQQRLTTLWLLHWYIALRAGQLEALGQTFKKFTYETRVSSRDFCEKLCNYKNFDRFDSKTTRIVDFITNQTWFFSAWKQDPTIQAMLIMLGGTKDTDKYSNDIKDGIEEFFEGDDYNQEKFEGYWEYLRGSECKIVFDYLNLKEFKLTDDLYIKMNARGKQLTNFENFKADLIGYITNQAEDESLDESKRAEWKKLLDAKNGIPVKLDTNWTDIFWDSRSPDNKIDEIFFSFLNRFFLNEFIVQSETSVNKIESSKIFKVLYGNQSDDTQLSYTTFDNYYFIEEEKNIPIKLFKNLQEILDNFYSFVDKNNHIDKLTKSSWDKSFRFIPKYDKDENGENTITKLSQTQRVVFFAVCKYFEKGLYNEKAFKNWMRIVWNLAENGNIESVDSMISNLRLINELSNYSHNIYEELSKNPSFISDANKEQIKEEVEKAKKIVENRKWEHKFVEAENYTFFKGAIRFLFRDTNGNLTDWKNFDTKWEKAKKYFAKENKKERNNYLRYFISLFDDESYFYEIYYDSNDESWRDYILLNAKLSDVTDKFLKQYKYKISESYTAKFPFQKDLVLTNLLDYIDGGCYFRENQLGILYPYDARASWRKYVIGTKRNTVLSKYYGGKIEQTDSKSKKIFSNQKIADECDFFYGWDVDFSFQGKIFRWKNDGTIVLLKNDGEESKKNINDSNITEKNFLQKLKEFISPKAHK